MLQLMGHLVSQPWISHPATESSSYLCDQNDRCDERLLCVLGTGEPRPTAGMVLLLRVDQRNIDTGINDCHESPALLGDEFHATLV
jgi:hypothetical protein